jgi:hypothetical protein
VQLETAVLLALCSTLSGVVHPHCEVSPIFPHQPFSGLTETNFVALPFSEDMLDFKDIER